MSFPHHKLSLIGVGAIMFAMGWLHLWWAAVLLAAVSFVVELLFAGRRFQYP